MNHNDVELEIDLLALLNQLRKKAWIILAVTAVCTVLGLVVSLLFITPQYTASTRMYVLNRSNENAVVSSDFQISNYMISDYQELIKGRNVTSEVIEMLGLDMTDSNLADKITISSPSNTRILHITVEDSDPQRAAKIANTVREVTASQLKDIMQVDAVTTIYDAVVPANPSSPNVMKNAILAGLLGFVAAAGVICVIYILDDRIRNEDAVERYLGLSTLGVIPDIEKLAATTKTAGKKTVKKAKGLPEK